MNICVCFLVCMFLQGFYLEVSYGLMIIFYLEVLKDQEEFISHLKEKGHSGQRKQSVQKHRGAKSHILGKSQFCIIGM